MKIYESGEDYLETMLILHNEKGYIRSVDIADKLEFSKPSVSRAVAILKRAGYVFVDGSGNINLSVVGKKVAEKIYERHCFLIKCFRFLGVDEKIAKRDACRVEHVMSEETFEKFKKYFDEVID